MFSVAKNSKYILIAGGAAIGGFIIGLFYFWPTITICCGQPPRQPTAVVQRAFYSTPDFYQQAFDDSREPPSTDGNHIRGALVNHHLLAPQLIATTLKTVANEGPSTIILISPDHFGHNRTPIVTSRLDWQTADGLLFHDERVEQLIDDSLISVDEEAMSGEHGIGNIVGFIRVALPDVTLVPLTIRDDASPDDIATVAARLYETFPDAVIIGSFDFSHYLPKPAADFHDVTSWAVLDGLDVAGTARLDIDSRPGLALLLTLMRDGDPASPATFTLFDMSSAANIMRDSETFENTSYITGVFTTRKPLAIDRFTALFVGDMFFDRNIRKAMATNGLDYPLAPLERFLSGSDLTVGNLEGPVTDNRSVSLGSQIGESANTTFTFDPATVPMLEKYGFTTVSLANNHTLNFGGDGLAQTRQYVADGGLAFFGDPQNSTGQLSAVSEVRGKKIGFVGYHGIWGQDPTTVIDEIKKLRPTVDWLIVYPHWGTEYQPEPSAEQRRLAHEFIDSGADLIIGAHPHVIQPLEIYHGKAIFYSLGNFLFDQTFSTETSESYAVGLDWRDDGISYTLFPLFTENFQTALMTGPRRAAMLSWLAAHSTVGDDLRSGIRDGIVSL